MSGKGQIKYIDKTQAYIDKNPKFLYLPYLC